MQFADVFVLCDQCDGMRFAAGARSAVSRKGIHHVLGMTVREARRILQHFAEGAEAAAGAG